MPQGLAPFCLVTMGPVKIAVLGRVSAAIAGLRSQRPWPPNVLIILDTSEDSLYGSLEGIELPGRTSLDRYPRKPEILLSPYALLFWLRRLGHHDMLLLRDEILHPFTFFRYPITIRETLN